MKRKFLKCPHCHKPISGSDVARSIALQGAGRKPTLKPCEFCGKEFGTVEMRKHIPLCPINLKQRAKAKAARLKTVKA